jgi:hypothetical protein
MLTLVLEQAVTKMRADTNVGDFMTNLLARSSESPAGRRLTALHQPVVQVPRRVARTAIPPLDDRPIHLVERTRFP